MIIFSELLSEINWIEHGFGTAAHPIPLQQELWENRPSWKQVHGNAQAEVLHQKQQCGTVDALFTQLPKAPVAVATADCVPILLAHRSQYIVAAIHAGWRGTLGRIVEKTLLRLTHQQSLSKDWIAVIGPSIGPCCYEVDAALAHQFSKEFDPNETAEMIRPGRQDHAYLDLRKANEIQISQSGVKDVEVISKCTACATDDGNPQFFSFRRDASKERQFTAISIKTAH